MRRRRFLGGLAVAGLGGLAGCAQPNGSLRLTPLEDDAALTGRYARSPDDLPPEPREFVVSIIEDGPRIREGPGFDPWRAVEHEGVYYRIEREVVATRTEVQYVIEADYDPERPVAGPTVALEDLPAEDRAAVENLLPPPEGHATGEGYDLGRGHSYPDDAESVLVPEPAYEAVSVEGTAYPIRVERAREIEVETYRYSATEIAASAADLATMLRDRYRFRLAGLSAEERSIVEAAIGDGYRVDDDASPPAAFGSLLDRFRAEEAIRRDDDGGDWLVRYDGAEYWADVGFPIEGTPGGDVDTPAVTPPPE